MSLATAFLIALALAMDAFAVSIGSGATIRSMHLRHALRIGLFFGAFQAAMPLLGWSLGLIAADYIQRFDHWIAFFLLAGIGGKMLWESRRLITSCEDDENGDPLSFSVLILLSVATSIDALAVGVTLSFLKVAILAPVLIIGAVAFLFSFSGMYLGMYICDRGSDRFSLWVERAGGVVLIGIGAKILIEHLFG